MNKLNCWEFKKCGREQFGASAGELGVCPAATEIRVDQINHGRFGGRACWAIAGTLCGGKEQGTFAQKLHNCLQCDFYLLVRKEEGKNFMPAQEILKKVG